jgi:hypothetical protein
MSTTGGGRVAAVAGGGAGGPATGAAEAGACDVAWVVATCATLGTGAGLATRVVRVTVRFVTVFSDGAVASVDAGAAVLSLVEVG